MNTEIKELIAAWSKHNIGSLYCQNKEEALKIVLDLIPLDASVGFSGSATLDEAGIIESLKKRGNKVFDPYLATLSKEESLAVRKEGALAEYYLASANAISQKGELVFFSAFGNRICGVSAAKNVIVICGINKITSNLEEAIKRAREYATPLNCKRLNWNTPCAGDGICRKEICLYPEYKRMCCQILGIEAEVSFNRLIVVLVEEKLGF